MKDSRTWSHMSTRTTDANYLKYSCQSVPKQQQEGKGEEKKNTGMIIAKLFAITQTQKSMVKMVSVIIWEVQMKQKPISPKLRANQYLFLFPIRYCLKLSLINNKFFK